VHKLLSWVGRCAGGAEEEQIAQHLSSQLKWQLGVVSGGRMLMQGGDEDHQHWHGRLMGMHWEGHREVGAMLDRMLLPWLDMHSQKLILDESKTSVWLKDLHKSLTTVYFDAEADLSAEIAFQLFLKRLLPASTLRQMDYDKYAEMRERVRLAAPKTYLDPNEGSTILRDLLEYSVSVFDQLQQWLCWGGALNLLCGATLCVVAAGLLQLSLAELASLRAHGYLGTLCGESPLCLGFLEVGMRGLLVYIIADVVTNGAIMLLLAFWDFSALEEQVEAGNDDDLSRQQQRYNHHLYHWSYDPVGESLLDCVSYLRASSIWAIDWRSALAEFRSDYLPKLWALLSGLVRDMLRYLGLQRRAEQLQQRITMRWLLLQSMRPHSPQP